MSLELIAKIVAQLSILIPVIQKVAVEVADLWADVAAGVPNSERIQALRDAGATLDDESTAWLRAHGYLD